MSVLSLRPESGARFHQSMLGMIPVAGYLAGWEGPVWVALGLSMAAIISVRAALLAHIWPMIRPEADAHPIYFNHSVHRMDELVRTILFGSGLVFLRTGHDLGWLPILAAASIAILAGATGFSFVTAFYALPKALVLKLSHRRRGRESDEPPGNPKCMVCRALGAAPYHRCTWCNLTSVRSCCAIQTTLLLALMLAISFLLTSSLGLMVTKILVSMSILGVVALGLAITRQTDDLVKSLEELADEHHRAQERCVLLKHLAVTESVSAVAEEIVKYVETVVHARRISVMVADEEQRVLRIAAARGMAPEAIQSTEVPIGQRICGRVFSSGRPVVMRNVLSERPHEALGLDYGGAMASYPLMAAQMSASGRRLGVVNATDKPGGEFTDADLRELEFVSEAAAIGLASQMNCRDLERSNFAAIVALAKAVEAKDPYTHGHSRRVEEWATALGRELGLSGQRLQALSYAAELHDIGKLAVPDSILQANRRLTQDEWDVIREHPRRGAEIIEHFRFLRDAQPAILYHHERFDGHGYPASLAGDGIPLEARILAVVDAYDAMTSNRAYRNALTHDQAAAELLRWAGRQFDPAVVDAFLRSLQSEVAAAVGAATHAADN
jgi:HD-GYP domain-containing protein (c-di-GMP phosphodiesterase class II)